MNGTQQASKKYELSTAEIQRRYLAALADLVGPDQVALAKALHDAGAAAARGRYTLDEVIHGGKVPASEDLEAQAARVEVLEQILEDVSALTHRSYE